MTARVILGILALAFGFGFAVLSYATWGVDNHVIALPYKECAVAAVVLLGLAGWVWFA